MKICSNLFFLLVALLSGARNKNNYYLAENIYNRMKKLFPDSSDQSTAASILLANIYASTGDIEKAGDIRNQLGKSGAKKKIGLSWTVVNGKIYVSLKYIIIFYRNNSK